MTSMARDRDHRTDRSGGSGGWSAALAAKSDVLALLEADETLRSAMRSVGIGRDAEGARCVRVGIAAEALDSARAALPDQIGGVEVQVFEASPIRAEPHRP